MMVDSIGIFGGTFDPIHLGHLHLAREALHQKKLDKVLFIPCFQSAHEKNIQASPADRLAMVKLAIADEKCFIADDREICRQDISYMVTTLESLRGDYSASVFHLIMASDAFAKFTTWHRWRDIFEMANLLVANRDCDMEINAELAAYRDRISFIDIKPLPISATEIRELIKNGKNVEHLLPKSVWQYIVRNSLYKIENS